MIDRLHLTPSGSEGPISIVMMAGAVATLGAQWGLIPRLGLGPRALILWGALIAAAGLVGTMLSHDLYGITIGFARRVARLRIHPPGLHGGGLARRADRPSKGAVAGVITAANGISYVLAPALGIGLYELGHDLPFAAFALLLLGLAAFGRSRLEA